MRYARGAGWIAIGFLIVAVVRLLHYLKVI